MIKLKLYRVHVFYLDFVLTSLLFESCNEPAKYQRTDVLILTVAQTEELSPNPLEMTPRLNVITLIMKFYPALKHHITSNEGF